MIGSSTGGPGHIERILSSLDMNFDATIVIAQHMGSEYLASFAKSLDEKCKLDIKLIDKEMIIEKSCVYVCDGICEFNIQKGDPVILKTQKRVQRYNPDIDILFKSAIKLKSKFSIMGVILSGIGDDGSDGCDQLIKNGIECFGENQESAVVFGMPKHAKEKNSQVSLKSLQEIIKKIQEFGKRDV